MKLNLGSGPNPLDGFVNLDQRTGWRFEAGLPYEAASVEAITISHALMYVRLDDWPAVFSEFARVLYPDGIIRITEDATDDQSSLRYGGHQEAATLTSVDLVGSHLRAVGFRWAEVGADETMFIDGSLCQRFHGDPPKVFFVEGVKL